MAASVESEVVGAVASSANMCSGIGAAVTAETKVEIGVEVKVEVKGTVEGVCSAAEVRSGVESVPGDFPTLSPQRVLLRGTINGSTLLLLNPSLISH